MAGLKILKMDTIVMVIMLALFEVSLVLIFRFTGGLGDFCTELLLSFIISVTLYGIYETLKSE